jgi:hypothetical protein
MARRRAEKAQRIVEDAELVADRRAEEKQSTDEGEETKTNPSEKSRPKEIAKAEATLAAEQKKRKAKEEARRKAKEAKKIKLDVEAHTEVETKAAGEDPSIKKRALKIGIGAFIAVAIIWAFTIFNTSTEEPLPAVPKNKAATVEESNELEKPNLDSLNKVAAFAKLAVGDHYDGGIIFAIDHANKTGKIAHLEDAGPMPWYNAVKIDEQLGEGWRLPSFDELTAMYKALGPGATNIGEFTNELYWSSTAYDENQARLLRFWDGNTSYHYNKNVEHRKFKVRAIRDFRL